MHGFWVVFAIYFFCCASSYTCLVPALFPERECDLIYFLYCHSNQFINFTGSKEEQARDDHNSRQGHHCHWWEAQIPRYPWCKGVLCNKVIFIELVVFAVMLSGITLLYYLTLYFTVQDCIVMEWKAPTLKFSG